MEPEVNVSEEVVSEVVTADSEGPNYKPVVFDKPQFDAYVTNFSAEGQDAEAVIAEMLAEEVLGQGAYQGLLQGTSTFFDTFAPLRDRPPAKRSLTNDQIISLLAQDTEGNPIESGTFLQGFQREIAPAATSLAGFMTTAKLAAKAPIPNPLAKGVFVLGSGVVGSLLSYKGGELLTDSLIGPEKPMLPGQTAAYESGKTAAGVLGWLPFPFMLSKNIGVGTSEFIKNLADKGITPSRKLKLYQGAQNLLGKTASSARGAPLPFLAAESISGVGQVGGAGFSEIYFQGNPLARILFEGVGGVGTTLVTSPLGPALSNYDKIMPALRRVKATYEAGGLSSVMSPLKNKRQRKAVERILSILEVEGDDIARIKMGLSAEEIAKGLSEEQLATQQKLIAEHRESVITRLAGEDLGELLLDSNGKPIQLTAGAKGGSPALLAIEVALEQLGAGLSSERTAGSQASIKALKNVILAMAQTGDQDAIQTAADLAEDVFSAQINERMAFATSNLLEAFDRVKKLPVVGGGERADPESNLRLSEKLFDVITTQLSQSRSKEKTLWSAVPDIDITSFTNAAGETTNAPSFIAKWNQLRGVSPELKDKLSSEMPLLEKFVNRKTDELGLNAAPSGGAVVPLSTKELTELRSIALDYAKSFAAGDNPNQNAARIASEMASSMLDDLTGIALGPKGESYRFAYDIARSYSRSLNDTFTRAFAGDATKTKGSGASNLGPELLSRRILQGGNDPTYLRLEQINDIGTFAVREGLEDSATTVGTLRGVTEQILRNARAATFNPDTGEINPDALAKWISNNDDILNQFPALRTSLEDARSANIMLKETSEINLKHQAEEIAQLSFYDLMNPVISATGKRVYGTESPSTAIARVFTTKTPIRQLNRLLKVVTDAPEELREQAMTGLKSSILEWASTKAGGSHSGTFSPSSLYDDMFRPRKGARNRVSLVEWMKENKVMNEAELDNLKTYLTEMVRFEASEKAGDIGELVDRAGPMLDFYLGITGSALGTRAQRLFTGGASGPGALIAAGQGAETMRRIFADIPAALQTDVMSELMSNPALLASMMRKPRSNKEYVRLSTRVGGILKELGFAPIRREASSVPRELDDEDDKAKEELRQNYRRNMSPRPDNTQQGSLMPAQRAPTPSAGTAPLSIQQASAAPGPSIQNSGPVDRERFAALFPNDSTTQLMKSGIGSLA